MAGEIDNNGKSLTQAPEQEPKQKMDVCLEEGKLNILKEVMKPYLEECGYQFPNLNGLIIGKARSDDLKATKSISTNILIKLFHTNKPAGLGFKQFVEQMKARSWNHEVRIEASGYLTIVNLEKDDSPKPKPAPKAPAVEESKVEAPSADQLDYTNFFDEIIPFPKDKQMKHTYRVKISRAVYTKQCFDVFCKYEKSIHKKNDK